MGGRDRRDWHQKWHRRRRNETPWGFIKLSNSPFIQLFRPITLHCIATSPVRLLKPLASFCMGSRDLKEVTQLRNMSNLNVNGVQGIVWLHVVHAWWCAAGNENNYWRTNHTSINPHRPIKHVILPHFYQTPGAYVPTDVKWQICVSMNRYGDSIARNRGGFHHR